MSIDHVIRWAGFYDRCRARPQGGEMMSWWWWGTMIGGLIICMSLVWEAHTSGADKR